jgi:hypothetical protein
MVDTCWTLLLVVVFSVLFVSELFATVPVLARPPVLERETVGVGLSVKSEVIKGVFSFFFF